MQFDRTCGTTVFYYVVYIYNAYYTHYNIGTRTCIYEYMNIYISSKTVYKATHRFLSK